MTWLELKCRRRLVCLPSGGQQASAPASGRLANSLQLGRFVWRRRSASGCRRRRRRRRRRCCRCCRCRGPRWPQLRVVKVQLAHRGARRKRQRAAPGRPRRLAGSAWRLRGGARWQQLSLGRGRVSLHPERRRERGEKRGRGSAGPLPRWLLLASRTCSCGGSGIGVCCLEAKPRVCCARVEGRCLEADSLRSQLEPASHPGRKLSGPMPTCALPPRRAYGGDCAAQDTPLPDEASGRSDMLRSGCMGAADCGLAEMTDSARARTSPTYMQTRGAHSGVTLLAPLDAQLTHQSRPVPLLGCRRSSGELPV